ncbi:MAG: aspartyl/asparaginyl beta-hydroxylase domain-containing protein [Caulobacter sp.]|nr:aspartyl/asparaginyl beta-hydroxylase domain-containing protein [Caulobacter sp.]
MQAPTDPRSLIQSGAQALGRGDFATARDLFDALVASGKAEAPVWLGLAVAHRGLRDPDAMLAALDQLLLLEPRHLRGLIMKADHFADAGDSRAAAAFYRSALRAAPPPERLPAEIASEVRRARTMSERYAADYEAHLRATMASQGVAADSPAAARFSQSIDLMLGKKQIFLQEPRHYYFPGLPQIQFYDREPFPWLERVEAATGAIRDELKALLADGPAFTPYLESRDDRPQADAHGMRDSADWSALYVWRDGAPVEAVASRCPATLAAMEELPLCRIDGRTPSILFSRLAPGARIPPHNGFINARLIGHLPLIVPDGCGFRVGNETREWREGEAWLFDDTIEHEAWNSSNEDRIILIFDIWRPELTLDERAMVAGLFAAVDAYGEPAPAWSA